MRIRTEEKVVQMIPATGWRSIHASDDGSYQLFDLVCWALSSYGHIDAMYADGEGCVTRVYSCEDFVGIIGPSDDVAIIPEWVAGWLRRKERKAG